MALRDRIKATGSEWSAEDWDVVAKAAADSNDPDHKEAVTVIGFRQMRASPEYFTPALSGAEVSGSIGTAIGLGIIITVILFSYQYWHEQREKNKICGVVEQIGGCDGDGNCAVQFTDYSKGFIDKPLKGSYACGTKEQ